VADWKRKKGYRTYATKDMDDDIRVIVAETKAMPEAKQRLRELIEDLNQRTSRETATDHASDNIGVEQVTGNFGNGQSNVIGQKVKYGEPWPDIKEADIVAENEIFYDLSGGGFTIQGVQSLLDDLNGKLDGMNESSEMTSLRLQMTMDRRSKFISTLSQMMMKISTTRDILVQNIK